MSYQAALEAIRAAGLSAPAYRTAREFLDRAIANGGYVEVSHDDACKMVGSEAWGTVRHHFLQMHHKGLIMKWLNHSTRVYFVDFPPPEWVARDAVLLTERTKLLTERAKVPTQSAAEGDRESAGDDNRALSQQNRALSQQNRALSQQNRALSQQFDAATYTPASAGSVGWLVGNTITPDQQDTNQPPLPPIVPPAEPNALSYRPTETERAMSWALLTKSGMLPKMAAKWARCQPFGRVRDGVAHWYVNRKSQGGEFDEEPRILHAWFENWDEYLIPPLTAWQASERSPLWPLRDLLFTPAELEAEERRIAAEQEDWQQRQTEAPPTPPGCGPPPLPDSPFGPDGQVDPVAAWALMQAELKAQMPSATYNTWVRDTWAVDFRPDAGVFTVGLGKAGGLDWLESRLKPKIQRALGSLLGGKITVEFVVIQGGPSDV